MNNLKTHKKKNKGIIFICYTYPRIFEYDIVKNKTLRIFDCGMGERTRCMALSPDKEKIAVGCDSGIIVIFHRTEGTKPMNKIR